MGEVARRKRAAPPRCGHSDQCGALVTVVNVASYVHVDVVWDGGGWLAGGRACSVQYWVWTVRRIRYRSYSSAENLPEKDPADVDGATGYLLRKIPMKRGADRGAGSATIPGHPVRRQVY